MYTSRQVDHPLRETVHNLIRATREKRLVWEESSPSQFTDEVGRSDPVSGFLTRLNNAGVTVGITLRVPLSGPDYHMLWIARGDGEIIHSAEVDDGDSDWPLLQELYDTAAASVTGRDEILEAINQELTAA